MIDLLMTELINFFFFFLIKVTQHTYFLFVNHRLSDSKSQYNDYYIQNITEFNTFNTFK